MSFELDNNLPQNWEITTIGELTLPYQTAQPKKEAETEFRYIDIGSIDNINNIIINPKIFLGKDAPSRARRIVARGDILFSTVRTYLKNIARVSDDLDGVLTSTGIAILRASFAIDRNFLFYFVLSDKFIGNISSAMDGTLYPAVNDSDVGSAKIPLPPLNEQKRIVGKIEALQTRSQRVKEAIDAIPQLLDQFRQSVLAAAFRGDLTADWRENNPDVEPASVLLERIRAERRGKWEEAELEKMKVKGKVPKDDKWKEKYKEPEAVDDSNLPELPEGWEWATVEQLGTFHEQAVLTGPFGATLGREDFVLEGIPVVTIGCLQNRGLDLSKAMYISQIKADELERYKLKEGDFLFSRMASVGRAAIVEEELSGAIFNYHLMRLRLSDKLIKDKFFLYYVRGASAVSQYVKEVNHGATRDGINTQQLNKMPVALPPIEEQYQIINIIEKYFDRSHHVDDFVLDSLEELQICNQSILVKAFRGELVPQNPNDEPASILLERIRAEREKLQQQTKAAKKSNGTITKRRSKKAPQQPEESVQMELDLE